MIRDHSCFLFAGLVVLASIPGCAKKEPGTGEARPSAGSQEPTMIAIQIQSSAFAQGAAIPEMHTCDGKDASPPLSWGKGPDSTRAWALIVDDPDAPSKTWVHWVLFNLPDSTHSLDAGVPTTGELENGARQGKNDSGKLGYGGPCPPSGKPHRYFFRLYALNAPLDLPAGATRTQVDQAMEGHILGRGELMGTYARKR
jgi:Raf kinase inhibitor-like YbhB/YbcL family protein